MNAQHTDSPAAAAMQPRCGRHFSAAAAILAFAASALPGGPAYAQFQFQDVTLSAGTVGNGESWGASWGDYNGDGWSDVFMSVHRGVPRLYRNNADGTFTDVAADVDPGVWLANPDNDQHAAAFADFDNDGDQDLYVNVAGGTAQGQLMVNDGGLFWDAGVSSGLSQDVNSRAPAFFDYSGDGFLDVGVTSNFRYRLFRQSPGGGPSFFIDSAPGIPELGTRTDYHQLTDLDADGRLDLIRHSQGAFPTGAYDIGRLPFTDITASVPSVAGVVDSVAADFDGDLRSDILTIRGKLRPSGATAITPNRIEAWLDGASNTRSKGFRFTSPGEITLTADYNPLGPFADPDVIVLRPSGPTSGDAGPYVSASYNASNGQWTVSLLGNNRRAYVIVETAQPVSGLSMFGLAGNETAVPPRLLENSATGLAIDFSAGLNGAVSCVSAVAGDFDNDMNQDIYMACGAGVDNLPNRLYRNDGTGRFTLIAGAAGAEGPVGAGLQSNVGVAESVTTADYDNDGFLDLLITNGLLLRPWGVGGRDTLIRNAAGDNGNNNHWLQIDLQGTASNRDGIGARVYVTAGGVTQYREQGGGYHRWSQNDRRLHFGLAGNQTARVEIYWPSGEVDVFDNVAADRIYIANEAGALEETTLGPPIGPPPPPPGDPACGQPSYASPSDTGVFLWRDCSVTGAEERWNVRITGGGSDNTITYAGLITSSATLQTEGFSLEGNDVLDSTPGDGTVDYDLKAIRGGQDGFALRFGEGADVCFNPATLPAGAVVKVGADGQTLTGAFNLQTLEACDGAPPPSPVALTARHSGKCADVDSASMQDGASVLQWTCTGGDHQRWVFEPAGAGYYTVTSVNSGLCLAVAGASQANAAKVVQSICNGSHSQQITYDNGEMRFRHSGQCMDVSGQSAADGADIIQWPCNGQMNQRFDRN
ncbi:MAG: RICIN domain-containing protein [Thiohalocapsa sp.]|nr:RICIN domain-containing protein [Thiohalocapsa sp.]